MQPTILMRMDPESIFFVMPHGMAEDDLQAFRVKFPKHHFVCCCEKHSPPNVFMAPMSEYENRPDCSTVLCPDENWNIPPDFIKKH